MKLLRTRLTAFPWVLPAVALLVIFLFLPASHAAAFPPQEARTPASPGGHSLLFIQNVGQFPEKALFQVRGASGNIWLADNAIWFNLAEPQAEASEDDSLWFRPAPERGVNLRLTFPGANPEAQPEPFGPSPTRVSYFNGQESATWRANVPVWSGVRYTNLYPGLDLVLSGENGRLQPRFLCHAACDPAAVSLRLEGAGSLALQGDTLVATMLVATNFLGRVALPLPQLIGIDGSFLAVAAPARLNGNLVSAPFARQERGAVEDAGTSRAPQAGGLVYSSYVGGSGDDYSFTIAVDSAGAAYATGWTRSADFPTTPGAYDDTYNGSGPFNADVFLFKLSPDGSSLEYATFIGGEDYEDGLGVAVDVDGSVFISGNTDSTDFPTTPGAFDTTQNGERDAFVLKLSPAGDSLIFSTLIGGTTTEEARRIAIVEDGNTIFTGRSMSADFPTTPGSFDPTFNGDADGIVVKLSADGSTLLYSTFLGGNSVETGNGFTVDSLGRAILTGRTQSTDFPTTPGAFQESLAGGYDVFVAQVAPDGASLVYATLIGGSDWETGYDVTVDGAGSVYLVGQTESADFPVTAGAFDETQNGDLDGYVVKFTPDGSGLVYSTFVGGTLEEKIIGVVVNDAGNAFGTGYTLSSDFPTTPDAYDTSQNGDRDAFVVMVQADGSDLAYASFLGGLGVDRGQDVGVDSVGGVYLTGRIKSDDFPVTAGAYDETYNGAFDAFVTKFDLFSNGCQAQCNDVVYVSSSTNGTIGGNGFGDEDILAYDTAADAWSKYFDGSDVGLALADVDGFAIMDDGSLLLSLDAPFTVPDVGAVDDSDVLRFVPTALGNQTAGTFEMYFDGSDVGLETGAEDVDAIGLTAGGSLLLSTFDNFSISLGNGTGHDLLRFDATTLGWDTSGSFVMYFDGSDAGLTTRAENVWGTWLDPANGDIYLTTRRAFSVPGLSGGGADIFVCTPSSIGFNTVCSFGPDLYWSGALHDMAGEEIDAIAIGR